MAWRDGASSGLAGGFAETRFNLRPWRLINPRLPLTCIVCAKCASIGCQQTPANASKRQKTCQLGTALAGTNIFRKEAQYIILSLDLDVSWCRWPLRLGPGGSSAVQRHRGPSMSEAPPSGRRDGTRTGQAKRQTTPGDAVRRGWVMKRAMGNCRHRVYAFHLSLPITTHLVR